MVALDLGSTLKILQAERVRMDKELTKLLQSLCLIQL